MIGPIQALRFIAASIVVLYHSEIIVGLYGLGYHGNYFRAGPSGVDCFFIISGFIMLHISAPNAEGVRLSPGQFLKKRFFRLVPLYWLYTLLYASLLFFSDGLFKNARFDAPWLIKSLLFIPSDKSPLVYVGWTLNYEVFFYLVFAVFLVLSEEASIIAIAALFSGLVAAGLFFPQPSPVYRTLTSPHLLEFLSGIFLCRAYRKPGYPFRVWVDVLLIGLGLSILLLRSRLHPALSWGIPWFFIFAAVLSLHRKKMLRYPAFFEKGGDASYSIYLVQVFVLPLVGKVFSRIGFQLPFFNQLLMLSCVLAALSAGWASYLFIERPLARLWRRMNDAPSPVAAA